MKATEEYIRERFEVFNREMFGGRLPLLPFELSDAKTFLGRLCFERKADEQGKLHSCNFRMKISTRRDLDPRVVDDTIIHEMIHYFIELHQLKDTSPHGAIFKSIMQSINAAHGRAISISHKDPDKASSTKAVWHVIAAMTTTDNKLLVKVLPRIGNKILYFHTKALAASNIASIELYLHNNPFFNQYPTSTVLRGYPIDRDVFNANIQGARRLRVSHGKLIQE